MNKQQLVFLAKRNVQSHRQKALDGYDTTMAFLRSHDDWNSCEKALKNAQVAFALYNKTQEKANIEKYTQKCNALLQKYHLTEKDLSPRFRCRKCSDTGFVNGKACSCLQREIRKLLVSQSNVQNANFTFENSSETDEHNLKVASKARNVCENSVHTNILLTGGTGSGKTYLLTACANLCAQLGKSVLCVTAYNLSSLFLECHLSDLETQKTIMDNLTEVDVLVIDDLGTENVYKNVTGQYLFALINERIARGKQTFISTNLSLAKLQEIYDPRIFSRLMDQKITFVAMLKGSDKRLAK